ncbi:nuclear transport factor 2 family protein [Streptomyces sp. NBC_01275]|uniref:nuclear transport factor 2 family protein n=1 Tax=Streptomyces sp. NBC_01275 TaxID=2903807 RepID=UPI002B1D0E05|nr:nuclear transport factor 2 family protein [Streptomyces sp. NBC_01275]
MPGQRNRSQVPLRVPPRRDRRPARPRRGHFPACRGFPEAAYEEKRVVSDGDLVLLHFSGVLAPGAPGLAVFDIFRFQDGRIAEHWDASQDVPETSDNDNTMF